MQRIAALVAALVASLAFAGSADAGGRGSGGGGLEFDFLFGQRSYEAARFSRVSGDASPSLISAFEGAPFEGVSVAGAGVEMNMAINGVRFAIGYARPYVQFSGPIITQDPSTSTTMTAQVRSMNASELNFGLGYQLDLEQAVVSADLVGTADRVDTDIAVGEKQGTYRSSGFGFSLRAGARRAFHEGFYFHASGQLGLSGSTTYGAMFGIGIGKP
jgi:hypothetical protein